MNWFIIIKVGLFEGAFAAYLGKAKEATGNQALFWYGSFLLFLTMSMVLLVKTTQNLPFGTGYAVWTGIGVVGTVLMGVVFLKSL